MDFDGNKVRGDWPVNEAGHAIHHAVLKARPDVDWVLHTHSRAGMAVACMKCGILPITQQAMFYHGQIAYHPWDVQTSGQEECDRLAADLGDNNIAVLENHGLLACGPTAADAFLTLYNIENACKVQVDVMASGQEIIMPSEEALARTVEVGNDPEFAAAGENWQAIRRILDAKDPSYKT